MAGIAEAYTPEQLLNRKVVIVANLQPRKLKGIESNGMIVAASIEGGKPVLAGFLEDIPVGAHSEVKLVDSHCHLDDSEFDADREEVIERARAAGVERMMAIGTGRRSARSGSRLSAWPTNIRLYMPPWAFIRTTRPKPPTETFVRLRELAGHPKVLAVGEIGLDYHYDFSPRDVQRDVLNNNSISPRRRANRS